MNKYAINEELLQQIESLQLILKNNTSGLFGGGHKSKTFGSSCEFADYRDYVKGDDITKIDWNAYARFEKLYVKLYLDERQLHTRIYIDASRSMDYGDGSKATKAIEIAATLAYLSICEMDKVSIYIIKDNKIYDVCTNLLGKDSFFYNITKLNDIEFNGKVEMSSAILPSYVGYGDGLSVIISDFLTDSDYEEGIEHLISKRRDLLCVQILNEEEIKPHIRGKVLLFDAEDINDTYKKYVNKDIINAYNRALEYVTNRLLNYCEARNGSYLLAKSHTNIKEIFFTHLMEKGVFK